MKKLMQLLMGLAMAILAVSPVWAEEPVVPDQTYITFMPVPDDKPMTLLKNNTTDVRLHPKSKQDTVYYRILSVSGTTDQDQTNPITTSDMKVETKFDGAGYEPIHVDESMINANGQFVVKAAVRKPDGSFSPETTAAYNVTIVDPQFATSLVFDAPEEFMVGEQYEMWVKAETADAVKEQYQGQAWDLIINWDGVIFSNVEYRFSEEAAYVAVDKEDLDDKILITRNFEDLIEPGVQIRFTIVRKRQAGMNTAAVDLGIGKGVFFAAEYLAAESFSIPFVDRPAADPTFSPVAGYIEKGNTVTIASATAGATIRYTLDGTEPTATTGQIYENPLVINGRTTIMAIAVTSDGGTSFVSEAVYSVVSIPQVTPASGKVVYDSLVEITVKDAEGVEIYYTLDESIPSKTNGTRYTAPFKLRDTILNVVAIKDGDVSPVVTRKYTLVPAAPEASAPTTAPLAFGTKVTLTCATDGAEIYYMLGGNGDVDKTKGTKYTDPIEIKTSVNLKAVAYLGNNASKRVNFNYKVALADPELSLPSGEVPAGARVTITCKSIEYNTDPNNPVKIVYTTDGTEPTKENVRTLSTYTTPIEITEDVTIKAMAWNMSVTGTVTSGVTTATYTLVRPAVPTFNPAAGEVEKGTQVELDCATEGAEIHYTVDGSEPTAESAKYETAILVDEAMTIKAISVKDGLSSAVATAVYTVKDEEPVETVAKPAFSVKAGAVRRDTKVEITCATEGATIYYTTVANGGEPTADSTQYTEPIAITDKVTIKAIAIKGELKSEVAEAAYTIDVTANEELELAGVSVYPNPSNGEFSITLPVAATVEVFSSNGALFQQINACAGEITLNIHRSGIYFLRITGEGRTTVKRVIVR